jgi:ATP-dependent Zn protease
VNQRLRLPLTGFGISLVTVLAIAPIAMATATMAYGEFMAQVEADKINQVAFSSDRTHAVVTQDGQRIKVNLPADRDLIDRLTKNGVEISVLPPESSPWLRIIQSLIVPLLLVGAPLALVVILIKNFVRT